MTYTKKSFSNCQFNPLCEGKVLDAYPELAAIGEDDQLLRYLIMVYDPFSPLIKGEKDINYRKGMAAELCLFDLQNTELMDSIYTCTHDKLPEMIVKYLIRFARSKEWAAICAFEYKYWESIKLMLKPINADESKGQLESIQKKDIVSNSIEKDIERLDRLYKHFFGEDEALEEVSVKRNYGSPEKMAKINSI